MLEMRPGCEACDTDLAPDRAGAFVCSVECTCCTPCTEAMDRVCPNCGGELVPRPTRTGDALRRNPASQTRIHRPPAPGP